MIVAVAVLETAVVAIGNVAEVAPKATVTVEGTVADDRFEDKLMTVPVEPAGPLRVTVPVEAVPPKTEVGETLSAERTAGTTVKIAVTDVFP